MAVGYKTHSAWKAFATSCGFVTDQWESHHRELYDQPTENQLVMMQQTLHDLCQQITEEITRQQNELEGFIQAG